MNRSVRLLIYWQFPEGWRWTWGTFDAEPQLFTAANEDMSQ